MPSCFFSSITIFNLFTNLSFTSSFFLFYPCLLNLLTFLSSLPTRFAELEDQEPGDQIRENPGSELADHDHPDENLSLVTASEWPLGATPRSFNGGRGEVQAMRKEKDWSRTLECKLLEERNSANGERMDLLWEAYEQREENSTASDHKKTRILDFLKEDDDDDGDEEVENVQPCCLKALNLGMSKPGLLKAFKGVGIGLVLNNHRKKGF